MINAILVQVKHGLDLSSSLGTRLKEELYRMQSAGAKTYQSILLFVGSFVSDDNGLAKINNQLTHNHHKKTTWIQVQAAIDMWCIRGGSYRPIHSGKRLSEWLELQEKHIKKINDNPCEVFYPERPEYHGQYLEKIKDFRIALVTVPGLGKKRLDNLYDYMLTNNINLCLSDAMKLITECPKKVEKIPLWGKKSIESVRRWLYDTK